MGMEGSALPSRRPSSVPDLLDRIDKFVASRGWRQYHSPKNLSIALAVEAAEVQEHFQWITDQESWRLGAKRKAKLRDEIADVAIYLFELAATLGIDPIDAVAKKLTKNEKKYPLGTRSKGYSHQQDWRLLGMRKT